MADTLGQKIGAEIDALAAHSGVGENLTLIELTPHKGYNDGGLGDGWTAVFSYYTPSGKKLVKVTRSGGQFRQDEASSYNDYGTLEGTLRAISDQSGGLEIRIQDPLWKRAIPCRVSDDQIEDAMGAFRRRVEVTGLIHYNRLGRPTSIRMEGLTTLPDDKDLPTAADIRGLFVA